MTSTRDFTEKYSPEIGAGGFSKFDGTVEFYGRVNSLLQPHFRVLDFGAGRAAWFEDEQCRFRKNLRLLRGKVARVIAQDVDKAVLENRAVDEAVVSDTNAPLPFSPEFFDLIVADFVFEHLSNPTFVCNELTRALKPGGWLCARTPNKWGYISVATRFIDNSRHTRILSTAQPARKERDVFPTRFELNTMCAVQSYFPHDTYQHYNYYYQAEPSYHFNSGVIYRVMRGLNACLPPALWSSLFLFMRKKAGSMTTS